MEKTDCGPPMQNQGLGVLFIVNVKKWKVLKLVSLDI